MTYDKQFVHELQQNLRVISHELEPWFESGYMQQMLRLEDQLCSRGDQLTDLLVEQWYLLKPLTEPLEDADEIHSMERDFGYVRMSSAVTDCLWKFDRQNELYTKLDVTEQLDAFNNELEEQVIDDAFDLEPPEHFLHALRGKEIPDVIVSLNKYWMDKWQCSPWKINCGDCEQYADCLCVVFPEAESFWGNELLSEEEYTDDAIGDQYAWHCITKYNGRYYDSEHPFGVDDFRDISAFHSNERPT